MPSLPARLGSRGAQGRNRCTPAPVRARHRSCRAPRGGPRSPGPGSEVRVGLTAQTSRLRGCQLFCSAGCVDVITGLLGGDPQPSTVGVVLAAVSLVVMPALSWAQLRTGRELGSRSAVADSRQTLLCSVLSAVLLVGLLLNGALGWSWADPVAARSSPGSRYGRACWPGGVSTAADGPRSARPIPGHPAPSAGRRAGAAPPSAPLVGDGDQSSRRPEHPQPHSSRSRCCDRID